MISPLGPVDTVFIKVTHAWDSGCSLPGCSQVDIFQFACASIEALERELSVLRAMREIMKADDVDVVSVIKGIHDNYKRGALGN